AERDPAADSLDDADEVGRRRPRRHEVEHAGNAVLRLPRRLEDERVVEVAARARPSADGCELPAAVLRSAEQRGEARAGVEARQAEPVDRAAALDERRCLEVAEQCVVLYASQRQRLLAASSNAASYSAAAPSPSVAA